tara:strand:+ start:549 stop:704 length:156 start_codon:yes stop_codon:yes gene_type:complete
VFVDSKRDAEGAGSIVLKKDLLGIAGIDQQLNVDQTRAGREDDVREELSIG